MDALYSPSTHTLALFPRSSIPSSSSSSLYSSSSLSSLSSSSSLSLSSSLCLSSSVCLRVSLRTGHSSNLRLPKWDRVATWRRRRTQVAAALNAGPVVAVVVAVAAVSAVAVVYSNLFRGKRKKVVNEEVSVDPLPPRYEQAGKNSSKQGVYSTRNAELLQKGSLKGKNLSSLDLTESTSDSEDDYGGIKLSYQDRTLTAEETIHVETADIPNTNLHDLGAIATALSEKSELISLSLPQVSLEVNKQQSLSLFTEESESPAISEKSEIISVSLPEASSELDTVEPLTLFIEESEASALLDKPLLQASLQVDVPQPVALFTEGLDREAGLDIISPAHVVNGKDAVSEVLNDAITKDSSHLESVHEHDEHETGFYESSRPGREELYSFYEKTSAFDEYPEHKLKIPGSSTRASLENSSFSLNRRKSASKMLRKDHSLAAGIRRRGPVASHAGRSFYERKEWNIGGSPRRDTTDPSLQHGMLTTQVNVNQDASRHMTSYNRLLRMGRLGECVELLEDMDTKNILDMNKIYHTKFFDICRRQKAVKEAFRFTKLIPNPTLSTFNMLMSVCSAAQDSEGAFAVWQLVQQAGFDADCKLYTTLISTCAKSGKVDTMFEVFHEMVNGGVEPNVHTYGALIDGCARAGQVAKAFGAYGILRSKNVKPDRVVFNALITACGQSGAVERAFDVLAEMRAELHPIDPDHITIGALIRACTSAGQVDRVKGVYDMIDQYNITGTPELYTIAVNSCSQTGDWEFACKIYADMRKKGVIPDEMFFSALIDFAGHAGNLDAAFEVLQDSKTQGMTPGTISYSSLMGACSNTKNWERALELFEHIKAMNLNPTVSTVNALITALCDADQMQKALDVLSEMNELGMCPNDVTYSILLAASEKNDDIETGLALFSQAKADAVPFSPIMCKCLIKMCFRRYEKSSVIGEPVLSFKSGRPQIDSKWSSLALMIYREMIGAGLTPSMEMLSQVLGCLQLPRDVSLKKRLSESLDINPETSRNANLFPLVDGFAEYDPRAFSLIEEAASLGIVPFVSFKESPISVDARELNIHIAEVYILTVLKGLKHRLAAGARLPSINISLPVETTDISCPTGEKTINVSGRVSQAVGALFRRLRLPYQGNESHGKIRVTGLAVKRWFQPKLVPSVGGKQTQLGLSRLRLAKGISHQQRNIRTGNLSLD